MDAVDKLELLAVFFNDAANAGYLLAVAVLVLVMAATGVVWLRRKVRSLTVMADPGHNPDLDQTESALLWALGDEVARRERDR